MVDVAESQVPSPPPGDRWASRRRVLIPVLIALTSLIGAVGAWRASVASGGAASAERKAFSDTLAAQQQRTRIDAEAGSAEFTYARRTALLDAAGALRTSAGGADAESAARLGALADAYQSAADSLWLFMDARAVGDGGSLDLEGMREYQWASAADLQDLDPGPEVAAAGHLRAKAERLVGLTALLIAAALFMTLAEVSRSTRAAVLYFGGGSGLLVTSAILLVVVEAL